MLFRCYYSMRLRIFSHFCRIAFNPQVLIGLDFNVTRPQTLRASRRSTGWHGAGFVEIRDGLKERENVVTSANFLIDAESNLKSALQSLTNAGAAQ